MTADVDTYRRNYDQFLRRVAEGLEVLARDHLRECDGIDRIIGRAKDPESFAEKAARRDGDSQLKYRQPLTEIQDQVGLRVIVLYLADVEAASTTLGRYFQPIEERDLVPESNWEFGYFGHHAVMALPGDAVPSDVTLTDAPRFFELQIKTLFQHAWSEANHNLGYKPSSPVSASQQRLLAYAPAQAWGADRAFDELRSLTG